MPHDQGAPKSPPGEPDDVRVSYRTYVDSALVGLFVVDESGSYVDVNPAACQMLGYTREELLSMSITDVGGRNSDENPESEATFRAVTEDGQARIETALVHADGHTVDVILDAVEIPGGRFMADCQDITERTRYERALREQRIKYTNLVEQSHDGVAIITGGEFAYVNPQMEQLTGRAADDLLGMDFQAVAVPEQRSELRGRYHARLRGEPVENQYDVDIQHTDGGTRTISVRASTIEYRGEPAVLATLHDVTDRKRVEDRLREQNDMLRLFNEIIRHDIRNDMNVVLGYADLVGDRVDDPEVAGHVRTLTERSRHAVERTDIIRDLTELMLTDADGESRVDIVETVRESVADVTATTELTATINAPEPPVLVAADNSLEIVFNNLLTNAVNHNDAPDPHIRVTVELEDSNDTVTVQIADNGPGIPDEAKRRLFGRGQKGPTSPGTGIGLYLVDELLDSYDGDIWIEDNDPRGAVFVVRLRTA